MSDTSKSRYSDQDPRPDLAEDHHAWVATLTFAKEKDAKLWGLLHGLRCGGARLKTQRSRRGQQFFKLEYRAADPNQRDGAGLMDTWNDNELRKNWLMPHKDAMRDLFHEAPVLMNQTLAAMARKAG